jgi:hypothetical protein
MAYTIPWDEASPDGAITPAADIDVELQNLKTSIRERIEDVIPDWANDGVDPKTIPLVDSQYCIAQVPYTPASVAPAQTFPVTIIHNENGGFVLGSDGIVLPEDGVYSITGGASITCAPGATLSIWARITGTGLPVVSTMLFSQYGAVGDELGASVQLTVPCCGGMYDCTAGDILWFEGWKTAPIPSAFASLNSIWFTLQRLNS